MISIQPYFVFATYEYHKKVIMKNGIAHYYNYFQDCDYLDKVSAIPDGCVDILFIRDKKGIVAKACGTVLKNTELTNEKDKEYFGIRFMPGIQPSNLSIPMKELIEREVDLSLILKNKDILKRMEEESNWDKCINIFVKDYLKSRENTLIDDNSIRLVNFLKDKLIKTKGNIQVQELSKETGYSTRYINMMFDNYIGISPKTFGKIIQFQNSIQIINHNVEEKLTGVGIEAGYFDQAHFIREFKKHINMTPNEYRKMIKDIDYYNRLEVE